MSTSTLVTGKKSDQRVNSRWEQIGAAGGIAYVILQLVGQMLIQVGGSEPAFNAAANEIVAYFLRRNMMLATIGGFLSTLSMIALMWFSGVLWAELQRHEGESGWLSLVAFASGITGAAIMLASSGWELALLRLGDSQPAELAQLIFDQGNYSFANLWVAFAGMLLATGIVALRDRALPRWLGWFSLLVAVALLAARFVWFGASGVKFLPYMLVWVWLISTSVVLVRRASHIAGDD